MAVGLVNGTLSASGGSGVGGGSATNVVLTGVVQGNGSPVVTTFSASGNTSISNTAATAVNSTTIPNGGGALLTKSSQTFTGSEFFVSPVFNISSTLYSSGLFNEDGVFGVVDIGDYTATVNGTFIELNDQAETVGVSAANGLSVSGSIFTGGHKVLTTNDVNGIVSNTTQTNTLTWITTNYLATAGVVDFRKQSSYYVTNASFSLFAPTGVNPTAINNGFVLGITNTSGSPINVSTPAGWIINGMPNVTNITTATISVIFGVTNVIFFPIK